MLESRSDMALLAHSARPDVIPRDADGNADTDVLVVPARFALDKALAQAVRHLAGQVPVLAVRAAQRDEANVVDPRAGIFGVVATDVSPDELAVAVRTVAGREPYIRSAVAAPADASSGRDQWNVDEARLSPRERQALALIAQGYTHYQVARRMGIAKTTVETYVERIRAKLRLGNKAELTLAAMSIGEGCTPVGGTADPAADYSAG